MKTLLLIGLFVLLSGCSNKKNTANPANEKNTTKSVASQAIDGFTGKTAVDQQIRMKKTLEKVNKKQKEKMDLIPSIE